MRQGTRWLGLDLYKATIAVAVAEAEGAPYSDDTIANEPEAVRKVVQRLGREGAQLEAAEVAGLNSGEA